MQSFRMPNDLLSTFVEGLRSWGTVWAPVEVAPEIYSLEVIGDVDRARPDALRTILPFKKLLLQPRFTMFEGPSRGMPSQPSDDRGGHQIFFGAHPCDIHALKILDLLYLSDFIDPYYSRNRDRLITVGYGCWPDDRCFCASLGVSTADEGFDLFLTPLEGRFMVAVGSSMGDDIVRATPELFEPATREDTLEYLDRLRRRSLSFQLQLDVTDLPYILDLKREDPVWTELGASCLCCGSCSMVCPTCSCFNVIDEPAEGGRARRVRLWDSCLFPEYATVAGGHNFRGDRSDRVRNRYYHKQEAFVREFGMPSCVGCGRCIENCPTGINVVEVFQRVRGGV